MRRRSLRLLISAGPTREPIDRVRFLSNYSTGLMGFMLAKEALRRGHQVTMVCGPVAEAMPAKARMVFVERAKEMQQAMRLKAKKADAVIMAAAVADYEPVTRSYSKIRRKGKLMLKLKATPDIIGSLPRLRGQIVAGFALETGNVLKSAKRKLREKRLDLILAQDAGAGQGPFGKVSVRAWIVERGGEVKPLGRLSKAGVARQLLDKIESLWYGQRGLLQA